MVWWCGGGAVVVRWWCGGGVVVWWCGGGGVVWCGGGGWWVVVVGGGGWWVVVGGVWYVVVVGGGGVWYVVVVGCGGAVVVRWWCGGGVWFGHRVDDVSLSIAHHNKAPSYGGLVPVDMTPDPAPVCRALKKTQTTSSRK